MLYLIGPIAALVVFPLCLIWPGGHFVAGAYRPCTRREAMPHAAQLWACIASAWFILAIFFEKAGLLTGGLPWN